MAKKRNPAKRPQAHKTSIANNTEQKPWWKKPPFLWIGGIASALVVAVATSFGTGLGQHLLSVFTDPNPASNPPIQVSQEIRNVVEYDNK